MKIMCGNMWTHLNSADLFCITTNSTITSSGRLVMGAGIAKEARDRFPDIALKAGQQIRHLSIYGLIRIGKIGFFQTKLHWANPSDLFIIQVSVRKLALYANGNSHHQILLNYPGISHGRLSIDQVQPIIQQLPDNVMVWVRSKNQLNQVERAVKNNLF